MQNNRMVLLLLMGCAKKPLPTVLHSAADLHEAHLNAIVRELVPLVEEAAGETFDEIPFVRLGRRSDLERIVRAEAGSTFDVLYPEAPEWLRDSFIHDMRAEGIAGKYALNERILLVSPESMVRTAAAVDDDPNALDHVTRLVLAHEMAHALQDQKSDIAAQFESPAHVDAFQALRGTTEGHANFVEGRVAAKLGLEAVEEALNRGQGWDENGAMGTWSYPTWVAYGQGVAFIQWHATLGGLPRTWEILGAPPQRTRTLFVPEEYGHEMSVSEADIAVLDGVEQVLRDGRWFTQSGPLVEQDLRSRLLGVPGPELESALDGVIGGATRSVSQSDRGVALFVVRMRSREAAEALVALPVRFSEALAQKRGLPGSATALYVVEELEDVGEQAVRTVSGPSMDGETVLRGATETHGIWVRYGSDVVAIEATSFRPGSRLIDAAEVIGERLSVD